MERTSIRRAYAADANTIARIVNGSWRAAYAGIVPQAYLDAMTDEKKSRAPLRGARTRTGHALLSV